MVAKKSKSKRLECRQKYKITKRANEKKRKERKLNKNIKKKPKKTEIGIPNNFPFKQELLQKAMELKAEALNNKSTPEPSKPIKVVKTIVEPKVKKKYKNINSVLNDCDVILQVIDARDVLNSLVSIGKASIPVITKIDLVPQESLKKWMELFPSAVLFCKKDPQLFRGHIKPYLFVGLGGEGVGQNDQIHDVYAFIRE